MKISRFTAFSNLMVGVSGCLLLSDPPPSALADTGGGGVLFGDVEDAGSCDELCADGGARICLYETNDWLGYGSCDAACAAEWDGTNFSCILEQSPECDDVCRYCDAPFSYCL
ncbi:hypothetical protein LBMAG42_54140 [Deltaproteobacteria bacterium]|nr:hypothetical protein LBMAG42_54140 [Deltaproteobacteria bacterium]